MVVCVCVSTNTSKPPPSTNSERQVVHGTRSDEDFPTERDQSTSQTELRETQNSWTKITSREKLAPRGSELFLVIILSLRPKESGCGIWWHTADRKALRENEKRVREFRWVLLALCLADKRANLTNANGRLQVVFP